jgi:hypothetical protein
MTRQIYDTSKHQVGPDKKFLLTVLAFLFINRMSWCVQHQQNIGTFCHDTLQVFQYPAERGTFVCKMHAG